MANTSPLNPDTDGDGVSDGDEWAQGSDPNDPGDTEPASPEEKVQVSLTIGDPSASRSEVWSITVGRYTLRARRPGEVVTETYWFPRGGLYSIRVNWLRGRGDYDYQADVIPVSSEATIIDPDQLLGLGSNEQLPEVLEKRALLNTGLALFDVRDWYDPSADELRTPSLSSRVEGSRPVDGAIADGSAACVMQIEGDVPVRIRIEGPNTTGSPVLGSPLITGGFRVAESLNELLRAIPMTSNTIGGYAAEVTAGGGDNPTTVYYVPPESYLDRVYNSTLPPGVTLSPRAEMTFPHARYQSLSEIRCLCLPLLG